MSYDTPAPEAEEPEGDAVQPDEKITPEGVPTDDALPEGAPTDPDATDPNAT